MDNIEPFESPKELIQGAKEQLANLQVAYHAFADNCPYKIITHIDNKTGETVVNLRLQNRMPLNIPRLTSSILKEIRLALDQAMCDGALALGRKDAKGVYFPFGKSFKDLHNSRKRYCKGIDRRLVAYAMKFKPYSGGNPILWTISKLAGNSHERIIGAQLQDQGAFGKALIEWWGPLKIIINKWSATNNELEVARLPDATSYLKVQENFILTLNIIFSTKGEAVTGREIITTLHHFVDVVEAVVLGMEAETYRLLSIGTA